MQFREQGRKVQCIRSTYDPARKRSFQKVVGTFDRWRAALPVEGLEGLTDAEHADLDAWFKARQSDKMDRVQRFRVGTAGGRLLDMASAIRSVGAIDDQVANEIWRGLAEVRKALRKAGCRPPVKRKSASAEDEA